MWYCHCRKSWACPNRHWHKIHWETTTYLKIYNVHDQLLFSLVFYWFSYYIFNPCHYDTSVYYLAYNMSQNYTYLSPNFISMWLFRLICCHDFRLYFLSVSQHHHLLFKQTLKDLFLYGVQISFDIFIMPLFEFFEDICNRIILFENCNINLYHEKMYTILSVKLILVFNYCNWIPLQWRLFCMP